ncbi:aspartate--ammonia ligase [Gemmatimonadota bacterium]
MSHASYKIPQSYTPTLDSRETERAIKRLKDFFEVNFAKALNLERITAPLFLEAGSGINDDLNGIERPVSFQVRGLQDCEVEVVQSLAKWKRLTLAKLGFHPGEGIYTDMNAIRPDEVLDNLHSIYVDQWDWELTILEEDRHLEFLKSTVTKIYQVLLRTERFVCELYPELNRWLPPEIQFIHSEELEALYPDLSPEQRENRIAKEYGAVFIIGIGYPLASGEPHDSRAPDYDDWTTPNGRGRGLNGDILVWYPVLGRVMELSSMGIRVSPEILDQQLEQHNLAERKRLLFHSKLLCGELPASVGGGIGQSRLCMYFLQKAHIGEVQVGIWPETMIEDCGRMGIEFL